MSMVVSEEKSFEIVDGRTDDGRTDDGACLYYKLPRSLRLRWAKNVRIFDIKMAIDEPLGSFTPPYE